MSGHHATSRQPAPGDAGLDAYLSDFAAALHGPRRRCRALVSEIGDGLRESIAQHRGRGLNVVQARQAAIAEFGPPARLAAGFADELTIADARRTVAALLIPGPLVGIWWLLLLAPATWWQQPSMLWAAIPVLPIVGVAALAGLAVLATTGQLSRWLPETAPDRALTLVARLSMACISIDLAMLLVLAARTLTDHPPWPPALAATAVGASLLRLTWSIHTTRRLQRSEHHA
jgi:hypothetical protein